MYSKEFFTALSATWQTIGSDFFEMCSETGVRPKNVDAIEMCLDADRLTCLGGETGKAADAEFEARCDAVGYDKALKEVVKQLGYRLI